MSQSAARKSRWPISPRLKIALSLAVLEGILVWVKHDFTRWTLIIVSAPIIAFYLLAGRSLESETARNIAWVAAATQTFAVLLAILALVVKVVVLIVAGVFAAIAVILLLSERSSRT